MGVPPVCFSQHSGALWHFGVFLQIVVFLGLVFQSSWVCLRDMPVFRQMARTLLQPALLTDSDSRKQAEPSSCAGKLISKHTDSTMQGPKLRVGWCRMFGWSPALTEELTAADDAYSRSVHKHFAHTCQRCFVVAGGQQRVTPFPTRQSTNIVCIRMDTGGLEFSESFSLSQWFF